jgi:uncharacterized spore protein YtfJ
MQEIPGTDPKPETTHPLNDYAAVDTLQTTMDKFLSAANVEAVYGQPVREGETIVIPTAEVLSVAGFGLGAGSGSQGPGGQENTGTGSGGGGGGRVLSRPVAAIIISPEGVKVEPVVDVTKIALAAFTTAGFMLAMFARMWSTRPPKFE